MQPATYPVSPAWRLLARDLGLDETRLLRRAAMPEDLLEREDPAVDASGFCRMLEAFEAEVGDPTLALRVADALSFVMFDPPVFAAMCSDDLRTALERLSQYKRLCAPIALHVDESPTELRVVIAWAAPPVEPPPLL